MRYEILENGKVVNTIIADETFVKAQYAEYRAIPEDPKIAERAAALSELAALDLATGMSRTMREQFAALPTATDYLKDVETQTITLREKLK